MLRRPQALAPSSGGGENRRDAVRLQRSFFDGGDNRRLIVENALGRDRHAALDLRGGETPAVVSLNRWTLSQAARDVVAIAPVAFHRMSRRQTIPVFIE